MWIFGGDAIVSSDGVTLPDCTPGTFMVSIESDSEAPRESAQARGQAEDVNYSNVRESIWDSEVRPK